MQINCELEEIQQMAAGFEQAYALNMQYIQMATMHMTMLVIECINLLETQIRTVPITSDDVADPMDWQWDPPAKPLPPLLEHFTQQIDKNQGRLTPMEGVMEASASNARSKREGTIPPPTPGTTLGASESTSRKRSSTFDQGNPNAGGSGGGKGNIPPRNTAAAGNPGDSSDDSGSDPEVGKPPKKKVPSQKLLQKYIDAMIKDHKRRDKCEAPKPQPYKADPEDLERFLRQLENVWALEPHQYRKDITKIRYAANLLYHNTTDKHRDPVKWYEAFHPTIVLAAAHRLPWGARATLDPVWSTWSVFVEVLWSSFATRVGREQAVN